MEFISPHFNYWAAAIIVMVGIYGIIGKRNIIKKIIGLAIFQTGIILFYVSIGAKTGGNIPILDHHGHHEEHAVVEHARDGEQHAPIENETDEHDNGAHDIDPHDYDNPLPHVLMLTAIVVGVATLGLALALAQRIYQTYGTLEEDEILERMAGAPEHD